jgi:hypothetical protein
MTKAWKAHFGGFLGGFRIGGKTPVQMANPGALTLSDDGALLFSARYDPPGSGWLAVLATVITGLVVCVLAQVLGFMAGPGWLVWYWIFLTWRRQQVRLNLGGAETAVIDADHSRFGFRTEVQGRKRWIAFEIWQQFDEASGHVRTLLASRCTDGSITRPNMIPVIVLVVLLGVIFGLFATIILGGFR